LQISLYWHVQASAARTIVIRQECYTWSVGLAALTKVLERSRIPQLYFDERRLERNLHLDAREI
jgi:hypothetical protein